MHDSDVSLQIALPIGRELALGTAELLLSVHPLEVFLEEVLL